MEIVIKCSKFLYLKDINIKDNGIMTKSDHISYVTGIAFIQIWVGELFMFIYVTKKFEFYSKIKVKLLKDFK